MEMFGGAGRSAQKYKRVPRAESGESQQREERERRRRKQESIENLNNKIHAFFWVVADILLLYATDFWNVCFNDDRLNRSFFNLGIVCSGVFTCLILYAAVWLPYVKRVTLDIQVYAPRLIPASTAFGVLASLGYIIGLWPVYGLFTPIILCVNFFSLIMATHFLPAI